MLLLHPAANLLKKRMLKLSKNNVSMPEMVEQDLHLPLKMKLYTVKKLHLTDPVLDSILILAMTVKPTP